MLDSSTVPQTKHHEDTKLFENTFRLNRSALIKAYENFANPFEVSNSQLVNIVSMEILPTEAGQSVMSARSIGEAQVRRCALSKSSHHSTIQSVKIS